jgi:hypothetical protein
MESIEERKEKFDNWVDNLDDFIETAFDLLPENISEQMDYSIESLDKLEDYLLKTYTSEQFNAIANKDLLGGLAAYFGETARQNASNGYWSIDLVNKKNVYYNLPIMVSEKVKFTISPYQLVASSFNRNTGTFLSTIATNFVEYSK